MAISDKLYRAFKLFDEANKLDPNIETHQGQEFPKEVLYAMRMTEKLNDFSPEASEVLQLTARCQHICRWEIPRDLYEMNRAGYLKWRRDLKKFHAKKASEILKEVGYENDVIDKVSFLLLKKQLKKNMETQTLEDVICLVFLEYYFESFARKYPTEKLVDILKKTWAKMSEKGQQAALQLSMSDDARLLVEKALTT